MKHHMRVATTMLAALAIVATLAGPAAAVATGLFTGVAEVGKSIDHCNHDGTGTVSGAGIGLPITSGVKQAFYTIDTSDPGTVPPGSLTVVKVAKDPKGTGVYTGTLKACGMLGPVGQSPAQIGAACGMSKGFNGKGRIAFDNKTDVYSLHDITWKASAAGTFPFTASGQHGTIGKDDSGADLVTGVVQAFSLPSCSTKSGTGSSKTGGGTLFQVAGTFDIINGAYVSPNSLPAGTCKETGNPACLYKTKKDQAPKEDG